jgi:hypothetical protein
VTFDNVREAQDALKKKEEVKLNPVLLVKLGPDSHIAQDQWPSHPSRGERQPHKSLVSRSQVAYQVGPSFDQIEAIRRRTSDGSSSRGGHANFASDTSWRLNNLWNTDAYRQLPAIPYPPVWHAVTWSLQQRQFAHSRVLLQSFSADGLCRTDKRAVSRHL